uniref:Uncharacterized protein n=1 Tax=Rhizobium rhizogenes (strain K84 / ATCC BAA-868) TaxID=311403 RepID=Q9WWA3_RHIR8|nr:hypothetical protein [Rhizobium rhizogenes K84]
MTSPPENSTQALSPHRDRASVLGEVHARPFRPIETPARLVHFAFQSVEPDRDAERRILSARCEEKGRGPIPTHARHHRVSFENVHLRWERHNEFTTYCWYYKHPGPEGLSLAAASMAPEMYTLPQPGPHLVAVDLHIVEASSTPELGTIFAKESLCVMTAEKGAVTVATDFKPDNHGFVKILVINTDVTAMRIGALVQRLLELETYRLLALLCLPEAQRLEPSIREIENALVETTQEMTGALALEDNERLLDKLVVLLRDSRQGPRSRCSVSGLAVPIRTSCLAGSAPSASNPCPTRKLSRRFSTEEWRLHCRPAFRSRSDRSTCRGSGACNSAAPCEGRRGDGKAKSRDSGEHERAGATAVAIAADCRGSLDRRC